MRSTSRLTSKRITSKKRQNSTDIQKLKKEISKDEVKEAVRKMANSKSPGKDNIAVELMKYGPEELYDETSTILNNIFRRNDSTIKLGAGILLPLPKPKKPTGPLKNLRPITLLEVIRKVLSKIFMNRTDKKIGQYLSKAQSAYRKGRSTTDVVCAHIWIAAKPQEQDITIYIIGIDMPSAFDTIYREELIKIATEILDDDELRILRVLLSETTLEVKVKRAEPKLLSNIGVPQGDSISGPLFTIYFERALRELETVVDNVPIDVRDVNPQWIERDESHLPEEMEYADDCDFMKTKPKTLSLKEERKPKKKHGEMWLSSGQNSVTEKIFDEEKN